MRPTLCTDVDSTVWDTATWVREAGLWTAARIQAWNRGLVAARSDVHGFSDWREVPDLPPSWIPKP